MFNYGCKHFRKTGICHCNMYNADGSTNKGIKKQIEKFFDVVGGRYCPCVDKNIRTQDHICKQKEGYNENS